MLRSAVQRRSNDAGQVRRGACLERSREVRAVLQELAPVVQAASIDEFYLDLSGTERLFAGESLTDTAERFRGEESV